MGIAAGIAALPFAIILSPLLFAHDLEQKYISSRHEAAEVAEKKGDTVLANELNKKTEDEDVWFGGLILGLIGAPFLGIYYSVKGGIEIAKDAYIH